MTVPDTEISEHLGQVDPKLYRSISLDSYDFTTLSADYMGKIYFQVILSSSFLTISNSSFKLKYFVILAGLLL